MKIEVTRAEIDKSKALLDLMRKWEMFQTGTETRTKEVQLRSGNDFVVIEICKYAIHQQRNSRPQIPGCLDLEVAIAELVSARSMAMAAEVVAMIRKAMPLPLDETPEK